jgi:Holliday junction resolvasome RuvABC ATP-dependent DNA helicase subunit
MRYFLTFPINEQLQQWQLNQRYSPTPLLKPGKPKTKLGQRQALALHISPKQTDDISPFPKRQEEALTKLAKKAKKRLRTRVLFSGPSGTGKILAVEFLARKLEVTLNNRSIRASSLL